MKTSQVSSGPQDAHIFHERPNAQDIHGIAHVHGDGNAVLDVQGGLSPAVFAAVLHVIVDEKGVVKDFDGHGGIEGEFGLSAKGPAGGDAQAGTETLARALRIGRHEIVR